MKLAVQLAYEVIAMQEELAYLRSENERLSGYEKKYHEEVDASIQHSGKMMVSWLYLLLSDRIKLTTTNTCD